VGKKAEILLSCPKCICDHPKKSCAWVETCFPDPFFEISACAKVENLFRLICTYYNYIIL